MSKTTDSYATLSQETYLNLVRAYEALRYEFKVLFKQHGLSEPQYNVLRILRGAGEPIQVTQVAERMLTREPDMTRLFDRLVKAGLVNRVRCEEDRRVVWMSLAPKGAALLKKLDGPSMEIHSRHFRCISVRKLRELNELLEAVVNECK